ncbi:UDP-glucuronate 4-epimerase [Pseudacidovorax intermedius]|uniref:UDP-glucuronate 4-epimerase n=1 Tax=Pseudacidovorax intermedius TaxID=433924 RepID=A0A370F6N4_9BURK|nr:NAD(P)-dependent oxidoreductase [Pseudacidovorax intermedius]RDI19640.1 UDP-glucuronate 4-epimerase [Pseudacidovorax intermedius]
MVDTVPVTFITGAAGFVGLALVEHLLARGETVVGWDVAPLPEAAQRALATLPGRFTALRGDVGDAAALEAALALHRPQRLVLLAAVTAAAERERRAPECIFAVNLVAVTTALRLAAAQGVQRVLLASSGSAYGASGRLPGPLHETDTPLQPEGLYGISKMAAEAAAYRLADLLGMDLRIGRLGTCFGPWERDTGVRDTPSAPLQALRLLRARQPVRLPRPLRRDWLYVRDAAAAIAGLLDTEAPSQPIYNLAAGFEWSVADWCAWLATQPGFESADWGIAAEGDAANIEPYADYDRASMDITALRRDTGFVPHYDLPRAGADFLAWLQRSAAPAHV